MQKFLGICLLGLALVLPQVVLAWDGTPSGEVGVIEVTAGTNFAFRIWFKNPSAMCAGGQPWAYVNEADSNYKVYVAALLAAKASNQSVTVYTNKENIYCHIGHLVVN